MIKGLAITLLLALFSVGNIGRGSAQIPDKPVPHSYQPEQGYVPDAATAVAVAEAVWIPIYGKKILDSEKPFVAVLNGDIWTVRGTFHSTHKDARGGVAIAEISRIDARILRVSHGK